MALIGEDFRGGYFRRLYNAPNPAGLGAAVAAAIGLIIVSLLLQVGCAIVAQLLLFGTDSTDPRHFIKSTLVGMFPAALITAFCVWQFARFRGGNPREVLSLRWPQLGGLGWVLLIAGFLIAMYVAILGIVMILGIDMAEYTPGPNGESPDSGSAGLVKEAMFDIANEPRLFLLVLPSVALGGPIAEELIFRGQIFAALSATRLGISGTTLVTSAVWALMHASEPWLSVAMIFIMGLVFGWLLYRFGSLWVTMACHAVWNTIYSMAIFTALGP